MKNHIHLTSYGATPSEDEALDVYLVITFCELIKRPLIKMSTFTT